MMHPPLRRIASAALVAGLLLPLDLPLAAEAPPLTLEQVMADPDWIGNPPLDPYWGDDGRSAYYERKRDGEERRDLFRIDLASGKATQVEDARRGAVDAPGGDLRRDRKAKVYARQGDLFFKDLATGAVRQLTRTAAREADPVFLTDGRRVAFRIDKDVYLLDLASGLVIQAADLRLAKDPEEEDDPTFLSEQQERLFEFIREKKRKAKLARAEELAAQRSDPSRPPIPFYLGEEVTIEDVALSPSGNQLLAITAPKRSNGDKKPSKMPVWITENGQIEAKDVRAKVGLQKPLPQTAWLFDLVKHERRKLDWSVLPGIKDDPLRDLRAAAKARQEEAKKKKAAAKAAALGDEDAAKPEAKEEGAKDEGEKDGEGEKKAEEKAKPRPLEVAHAVWSDDGAQLALLVDSADNKDRWLATYDTRDGKLTPRHRRSDAAWINDGFDDLGWLRDNRTVYFLSEETGYSQLYLLDTRSGQVRPLTEGRFEVSDVAPSFDRQTLYYRANREHPGIYEIYRTTVATGKTEALTHLGGLNSAGLSLDEGKLLILHSSVDRPNELYVQDNRPGAQARQVTQTRTPEFLAQEWVRPEVVPVPSNHGAPAPIYSRVYTPPGFDPQRAERYPAVIFIHGAGYLQNAHFGWSGYFREFMFHTLLARRGYVVLDMDYRASAGYGRDWRTAIYRQMGHPEVEDLADGVAWLAAERHVDPRRVGTYGGSYGGFLTYMALFTQPDLFAAGAALRPVSDWAHYNEGYTSNILNTPELDPEAYQRSSPIEFAAGLRKPLLICDGMVDDNVFFHDNVRLVQRLIELKKESFEMAVYPVESHGFVQPTSWLDEYRRIFKLFETHLR